MAAASGGRPTSVVAAAVLLTAAGVAYLVDGIAVVSGAAAYPDRVRAAVTASGVNPDAFDLAEPVVKALPYVVALGLAIVALCLLGLAGAVYAGRPVGRILTWIAIGLFFPGHLYALARSGTPSYSGIATAWASSSDESGTRTFVHSLWSDYPALYRYVSFGLATFGMLVLVAVAALLAQGSASRFNPVKPAPPASSPDEPERFAAALAADSGATEEQRAELTRLVRRYLDGDLGDDEFAEARQRLLDPDADGEPAPSTGTDGDGDHPPR